MMKRVIGPAIKVVRMKILTILFLSMIATTSFAAKTGKITLKMGPNGSPVKVCCQDNGACTSVADEDSSFSAANPSSMWGLDVGMGCILPFVAPPSGPRRFDKVVPKVKRQGI